MRLFADPRRFLPIVVGGIAGVLVLVGVVQPNPVSSGVLEIVQILVAAGVVLAILTLFRSHLRRVRARQAGSWQSVVVIIAAIAAFALQFAADLVPGAALSGLSADVLRYVYQPLGASVLALLTFWAIRMSWRALQVRPRDAGIVVVVAALLLVASGPWAALVPGLAAVVGWIEAYPAVGVARGLLLGVGLGALIASIRLLIGFDQPYLDR